MLKKQIILPIAAASLCLWQGVVYAADTITSLNEPKADDLAFIAYRVARVEPPFTSWAEDVVKPLDEFKRPNAQRVIETTMRSRFEQLKNTNVLRINLSSSFGEYDDQYHEFDFNINDGSFIPFDMPFHNTRITINLTNGSIAQAWPLPPADVEKLLHKLKNRRYVTLSLKLQVIRATASTISGEPISLDTKILEYDILNDLTSAKLGHVDVH